MVATTSRWNVESSPSQSGQSRRKLLSKVARSFIWACLCWTVRSAPASVCATDLFLRLAIEQLLQLVEGVARLGRGLEALDVLLRDAPDLLPELLSGDTEHLRDLA